jgi:hypothetical protein
VGALTAAGMSGTVTVYQAFIRGTTRLDQFPVQTMSWSTMVLGALIRLPSLAYAKSTLCLRTLLVTGVELEMPTSTILG